VQLPSSLCMEPVGEQHPDTVALWDPLMPVAPDPPLELPKRSFLPSEEGLKSTSYSRLTFEVLSSPAPQGFVPFYRIQGEVETTYVCCT